MTWIDPSQPSTPQQITIPSWGSGIPTPNLLNLHGCQGAIASWVGWIQDQSKHSPGISVGSRSYATLRAALCSIASHGFRWRLNVVSVLRSLISSKEAGQKPPNSSWGGLHTGNIVPLQVEKDYGQCHQWNQLKIDVSMSYIWLLCISFDHDFNHVECSWSFDFSLFFLVCFGF